MDLNNGAHVEVPKNLACKSVDELTTQEQDLIISAAKTIEAKRNADRQMQPPIPHLYSPATDFARRVVQAYKDFYNC